MNSVDSVYPKARTSGLVVRQVGDQLMIYEFKHARVFSLNRPAALVWKLCDGRRSVEDIAKAIATGLGGEEPEGEVNEQAVWFALKRFQDDRLLDKAVPFPAHVNSSTRRQMLKWAAVGVPAVLSMVLPTAAAAESGDSGDDRFDGDHDGGHDGDRHGGHGDDHGGDHGGDRHDGRD